MLSDNIELFFDLVGRTARGLEGAAKAFATVKSALEASKAAGDADVKAAITELTEQVAEAKFANAELRVRLADMKIALHEAQNRKSDFDRYVLWETPGGDLVYRVKEPRDPDEPAHYLCPACLDQGRKSILQTGGYDRVCHACETMYAIGGA